jgi:iron complex transport system ATP-binding protein
LNAEGGDRGRGADDGPGTPVEITDLTVDRGGQRVLAEVSLSARPGELLGLVGPNGAGKTTLLQTVNGVLDPDAGAVRVGGDRVAGLSARETGRRVATVPQETALAFEFTVREVVAMGRHPHAGRFGDYDDAPVERALDRTDTARFADRAASAVSGGERKRVLLARALAQDAPVTLLDEPTGGLDVNHAVRTLELAREMADEGRTVVAAIHHLGLAARYCDRLALLSAGRLSAVGEPRSVLTGETLRAAFDANAVVVDDPVTGAPLVTTLPDASERSAAGDVRVHVLGGGGAAARLYYPLAAAGFDVSTGPLPAGDRDATTARALDCETVTVPPFHSPEGEALGEARELIRAADATVLAPVARDAATRPLFDLACAAGSLVLVRPDSGTRDGDPGASGDRDRPSGRERLRERARVVPLDPDAVVAAVASAAGDADDPDGAGAAVEKPEH